MQTLAHVAQFVLGGLAAGCIVVMRVPVGDMKLDRLEEHHVKTLALARAAQPLQLEGDVPQLAHRSGQRQVPALRRSPGLDHLAQGAAQLEAHLARDHLEQVVGRCATGQLKDAAGAARDKGDLAVLMHHGMGGRVIVEDVAFDPVAQLHPAQPI